jgi:general secretion pathway protein J
MALIKNNFTQKGMTLLEVLVAMTLMVVVSAISFASLNGLINAKHQSDVIADKIRQEQLTSLQLHKDALGYINRPVKDEFGNLKPALLGRYSDIEFSRNGYVTGLNNQQSELQRVHWYLQDHALYRNHINTMDLGNFAHWQKRKYLDEVKEFAITYENISGVESRQWPIANSLVPLKTIHVLIVMNNGTKLRYEMGVFH